ncbi:hypothetical protein Rhe02_70860 [Rhizocola hellebori]|uniref:DNA polymerase III subunit gamma/tau n=2 Tax=Rhizocola hellebori TaxID=1392758 RepID=A0A8J3QG47_9ACTN|nr:hypothetical protein Rhe02_70860 [Rhizocola hellebori]
MQALRSGRLNHAYLFSGPRGCGKTSSARILARSLNCDKGPTPEPCGECDSCRALAPDGPGSIDVIEIDAASHGGVDDARELRERAFFAPASSRFKIYIIDEAHMVSSAGFNALLKLVEEPPDYVKFVFATTEPEKVLGTIKSRTHHYPFRLMPPGVLRPYLEQLAVLEGVAVEPQVFPLVVRAGGGSARDALSVFDQLIAGSGDEGVTYARAVALLGVTDVALIDEMIDALAASDGAAAFATIDRVAEAGHDSRRYASDLLQRLRDLIVLRQLPDAVEKGLLDAPADELTRMHAQAGQIGEATLSRFADIVHNGLVEMRGAASPRLLLELITARMLLPAVDDSVSALLQRLERLEQGAPIARATAPSEAARPSTSSRSAATASGSSSGAGSAGTAPGAGDDFGSPSHPAASGSGQSAARQAAAQAARRGPAAQSAPDSAAAQTARRAPAGPAAPSTHDSAAAQTASRAAAAPSTPDGAAVQAQERPSPAAPAPRAAAAEEDDWPTTATTGTGRPQPAAAPVSAPAGASSARASSRGTSSASASSGGTSSASASSGGASSGGASLGGASLGGASLGGASLGGASLGGTSSASASSGGAYSGIDAQGVRRAWDEIVRMVGQNSKKAAAFAREAVVRELEGQTLILVFKHKIHADGVNNDPGPLLEAVHQTLGGVWSVRCEVGGDTRKPAASAAPAAPAARPKPTPATEDWPATARTTPAAPSRPATPGRQAPVQAEPGPQDDEVPYDPEFDGPPPPALQGFDPGDEPDRDTDSLAVLQTSEEQALESLRKNFNIEKIAEQGR